MAGFLVRALLDLQMAALELCPHMEARALVSPASSVVGKSLSHVRLLETPWTAARQLQLQMSVTISQSLLKFMSTEVAMLSNHLVLCGSLLLLPSIFPNIRVFPNKSALCIRWPKY